MHTKEQKDIFIISSLRNWYARYERPISSLSLVGGFIFDAIVLKRVDMFWENFWVAVHLGVVALCIIFINGGENEDMNASDPARIHFWLINVLQFTFGGLLSTYLVFYFRSGSLSVSWPFFLILIVAFVANESLKRHYAKLSFQISFFFLSIYSFAIFILPVALHRIGDLIFLLSGLASLLILWIFLKILRSVTKEKFVKSRRIIFLSISGIFVTINMLYFFNLIPPIPLSLKDAGIYHSVARMSDGNYEVASEGGSWFDIFKRYQDFHATPDTTVYAYSAIFAPYFLDTSIVHEWQRYDENSRKWITMGREVLPVVGGREGGFRTFSEKTILNSGRWRVNVETPRGAVLGRLLFRIIPVEQEPELKTTINQ
ncbi:MAG: DUF2914 domain-containing protein [Candidatus Taylorbacteria bacterium]